MNHKIFFVLFPILTLITATISCKNWSSEEILVSPIPESKVIFLKEGENLKDEITDLEKEWNTLTHDILSWICERNKLTNDMEEAIRKIDIKELIFYKNKEEIDDILGRRKKSSEEMQTFVPRRDKLRQRQVVVEYTLQKYPTLQNSVSDEKNNLSKEIQEYKKLITSIDSTLVLMPFMKTEKKFNKKVKNSLLIMKIEKKPNKKVKNSLLRYIPGLEE
jgi:chromosome segregation ATPase